MIQMSSSFIMCNEKRGLPNLFLTCAASNLSAAILYDFFHRSLSSKICIFFFFFVIIISVTFNGCLVGRNQKDSETVGPCGVGKREIHCVFNGGINQIWSKALGHLSSFFFDKELVNLSLELPLPSPPKLQMACGLPLLI